MFPNLIFFFYFVISVVLFFLSNKLSAYTLGQVVGVSLVPIIFVAAYNLKPTNKYLKLLSIAVTSIWIMIAIGAYLNKGSLAINDMKTLEKDKTNISYVGVILFSEKSKICLTTSGNKFNFLYKNNLSANGLLNNKNINIYISNGLSGSGIVSDDTSFVVFMNDGSKIEGKAYDDLAILFAEDGVERFSSDAKACLWIK